MDSRKVLTQDIIRNWVMTTTGTFHLSDIHRDLNIKSPEGKSSLRVTMHRLANEGYVIRVQGKDGFYRFVDKELIPLNWKDADPKNVFPVKYPFGIEKYAATYPKNIITIGGSKDAGKTAYIINLIRMNMKRHRVVLFNSESGEAELKNRLLNADGVGIEDWCFETYERNIDFADVIIPEAMNIIDFLELNEDFYKVARYIKEIFDKLTTGIAVIALQKNKGAEYARGGAGAEEKARIILHLDPGELTLKVAKNWAEGVTASPKGKKWTFQIVGGCNFVNIRESFE